MRSGSAIASVCCAALVAAAACKREARPFNAPPTLYQRPGGGVTQTSLVPGEPAPSPPQNNPFGENAWGISEGKRLFSSYNCVGCHANGGGGMGPALMDERWIYGERPSNVFETIVEGRPNGMPAFRGKIPDQQVWMLVAYVRSMSGNAPLAALPGRSDHLQGGTPENNRPAQTPVQTGTP
jgi:cytochrome c oxidase cbb3-type subunit 3